MALMTSASSALGAAKAATDVLDRSGITAVADDSGIEDGTRAATQAYNTEEMAVSYILYSRGRYDLYGGNFELI